jgi:adenylate kinase
MRYFLSFLIGLVSFMPISAFSEDVSQKEVSNASTVVILLGAPGSGKGTQATRICQSLDIPHISTGDLFRYNVKHETELGKKVKVYLDAGKLVPDSLVLDMLYDRLANADCKNGFLLDGFPRTLNQAEAIDEFFKKHSYTPVVINLSVPDDEVLTRITLRRTCPECQKIYHLKYAPPQKEGICDVCKTALVQRSDDTEEVVKERLQTYYAQTKPLEAYYSGKKILHTIDGTQKPDDVFKEALQIVKSEK